MFRLIKGLKTDSKEDLRCMRGSDGKLCFSVKVAGKVCCMSKGILRHKLF